MDLQTLIMNSLKEGIIDAIIFFWTILKPYIITAAILTLLFYIIKKLVYNISLVSGYSRWGSLKRANIAKDILNLFSTWGNIFKK